MPEVSPYKTLYELGDTPVPGFTVVRYIGSGSFGQVWEAQGPGDVRVAIKVLNFGGAGQEREYKAIELVKKIRNPFLVPIFGVWLKDRLGNFVGDANLTPSTSPNAYAITSTSRDTDWSAIDGETAAGETVYMPDTPARDSSSDESAAVQMIVAMGLGETSLHDRLKDLHGVSGVGIPGEKLLDYMEQVAQGIDYLNLQCGIIHRDIKPHNMLLVGDVAQVCDFGLAKRSDDIYNTVANMLTAAYCAPEAFDSETQPTPAMDQYALAVSYYELRTGKLPFASSSLTSVMKVKLTGKMLFDCVPPDEANILKRATSLDPHQRYGSCREFVRALRDQHSAAILPSPPPPPVAREPEVRKEPLTIAPTTVASPPFELKREHVLWASGVVVMLLLAVAVASYADAIWAVFSASSNAIVRIPRRGDNELGAEAKKSIGNDPNDPNSVVDSADAVILVEQVNSLGMKFLLCPAGTFTMGSPKDDLDASNNEKPAQEVVIAKPFQIGKYEVTQKEWKQVMATEPWQGKEFVQIGDDYPASYISWHDAIAFCQKLTALERAAGNLQPKESYRLPTEAEWEYACRAGTTTRYSFDDNPARLTDYGWFAGMQNTGNTKPELYPHPVGQKKANPWGLYDMHGNVREWCEDIYQNKFSIKRDPKLANSDALRVLRGGGWSDDALLCRAASRDWSSPNSAARTAGFRVLREVD